MYSYGQEFEEIIKVIAEDRDVQDRFGWSVDISGNYAVVGAYGDDFGPLDPNMGSAYIFEKTGFADWTFVQKISNSDQDDYDRFGWSVAIDGDYIVIGAYAEDHNEFDGAELSSAGSAYIYERDIDGVWNEVQKIVPSDRAAGDEFGWSVAIHGNSILVGSHFDNEDEDGLDYIYHAGSAYIFTRMIDGTWIQSQKLAGSGRAPDIDFPGGGGGGEDVSDQFGYDVSISDEYLIIGACHHDYNALGAAPLNEAGTAYIFELIGGVWTEVVKLQNTDRAAEDRFGFSVGISGDFAIVGAYTEDENAIGGATMANAGSAYLFQRDGGGVWNQTQKIVPPDRSTGDRFGYDVSIDGNLLVIGSPRSNSNALDTDPLSDAGSAYTYELNIDLGIWEIANKIDASDRQIDDQLGISVAISGINVILGAFQQNLNLAGDIDINDAGAAYIYSQGECVPTESSQTLTLCEGQVVHVGPYTYTETGEYVDVIFNVAGCDSTVTTNLTIIPAPTSSQDVHMCFGYPLEIGGNLHTEPGVFIDTVTTVAGCDSIVTTNLTFTPENSITQDITICWGETYSIGASTYSVAGTYTDVITSWALCDCTITTNLMIQLPVDKSISQNMNLLKANADDASYQWIKCSPIEVIIGATNQIYVAPEHGTYAVIVTEGVCSDTSSCVYVDMISIKESEKNSPTRIYPNPNNGQFTVNLSNEFLLNSKLILTDNVGKTIAIFDPNSTIYSIDLDNLSPGIYVLTLVNDRNYESIQMVVK